MVGDRDEQNRAREDPGDRDRGALFCKGIREVECHEDDEHQQEQWDERFDHEREDVSVHHDLGDEAAKIVAVRGVEQGGQAERRADRE